MNVVVEVLVWVVCLVLAAFGGLAVTVAVLRLASRRSAEAGPDGQGSDDDDVRDGTDRGPTSARARAALRGGTWIGLLERVAVTGTLLAGYPAGIALVVAIKGLGRYPELRDNPDASERFVIGTFASLIVAAAVGAAGRALLA